MTTHTQSGFSLIETVFAIGVLTVGALGMAGIFTTGMQKTASSPNDLLSNQKAAEAIESVFSARDSHLLVWAQLRNVSAGGVFKDGPQPMTTDGPDGVLNTADDGPVEKVMLPGPDQKMGTADDITKTLTGLTREIKIVDLSTDLRSVTVTITYLDGAITRSYILMAYISSFA